MLTFFPLLTSPRPTSFRAKFGQSSHLEVLPSKQDVEGSNPFSRSKFTHLLKRRRQCCWATLTSTSSEQGRTSTRKRLATVHGTAPVGPQNSIRQPPSGIRGGVRRGQAEPLLEPVRVAGVVAARGRVECRPTTDEVVSRCSAQRTLPEQPGGDARSAR